MVKGISIIYHAMFPSKCVILSVNDSKYAVQQSASLVISPRLSHKQFGVT